jgi:ribosomal protein S18 acetylase RimI-like enzyme
MVHLVPMSSTSYEIYMENSMASYAEEKVRSGSWAAETALELSRQSRQKLLPGGFETPGHHFFSIMEEQSGQEVGCIWYGRMEEAGQTIAFVYDFLIFEEHRRKGYGLQALQALDEEIRRRGLKRIALHVFGQNRSAQALYEKAGYKVVDFIMARSLE